MKKTVKYEITTNALQELAKKIFLEKASSVALWELETLAKKSVRAAKAFHEEIATLVEEQSQEEQLQNQHVESMALAQNKQEEDRKDQEELYSQRRVTPWQVEVTRVK